MCNNVRRLATGYILKAVKGRVGVTPDYEAKHQPKIDLRELQAKWETEGTAET